MYSAVCAKNDEGSAGAVIKLWALGVFVTLLHETIELLDMDVGSYLKMICGEVKCFFNALVVGLTPDLLVLQLPMQQIILIVV